MNRNERRVLKKQQHQHVNQFPAELTVVPESEWPPISPRPLKIWCSKKYLVQLYMTPRQDFPQLARLSICRTQLGDAGRWKDGLSWDELQAIKREVGFGDWYALEVYPRDQDVVNVANMRHLWMLPVPLPIGWFGGQ